jgi:hypothetical protein
MPEPTESTINEGALLQSLLGLTNPEKTDVRPVEPAKTPAVEPAKAPEPAAAPPVAAPPAAAQPAKKKVTVSTKPAAAPAPTPDIEEVVKRHVAAAQPAPAPEPEPDLTDAQREELDLVKYAEAKDPARKGASAQLTKFYAAEKSFLEKKLAEEGDDYDPSNDPAYRKFVAANAPKFTPAERQKFVTQRITEEAETRATERARKELAPEMEETRRKLREIEERPKLQARVAKYVDEVASGMPEEIVKFFNENGRDFAKVEEAYPEEFPIVQSCVNGAVALSEEFLAIRSGLKPFDAADTKHAYLNEFISSRAKAFLAQGGPALVRGGKQFVAPGDWNPKMANTHWTFDDEQVLHMLKLTAQRDAKTRIDAEKKRVETILAARSKRAVTPPGVTPPVETVSPKITPAPAGAAAGKAPINEKNLVASILGF